MSRRVWSARAPNMRSKSGGGNCIDTTIRLYGLSCQGRYHLDVWEVPTRRRIPVSATSVPITGRDGNRVQLDAARIEGLSRDLDGAVLRPEDEGYAQSVSLWNGMITK